MKCLISASINGAWVLGHRADELLPADRLINIVSGIVDFMIVKEKTFVAAEIVAECDCGKEEIVYSTIKEFTEAYDDSTEAELDLNVQRAFRQGV